MAKRKSRRPPLRPKRATRLHKVRVWFERAVLGVMMSVVAAVVERRLLKVLKSGSSSKKALQKAVRDDHRARTRPSDDREAGVKAGPDEIDVEV
jgi:hypothetical protein